jgi:hypothetical protein
VGEAGEVFVADGAPGFVLRVSQPPQPEVDGLFGGSEVRKDLIGDVLHEGIVLCAVVRKSRD